LKERGKEGGREGGYRQAASKGQGNHNDVTNKKHSIEKEEEEEEEGEVGDNHDDDE